MPEPSSRRTPCIAKKTFEIAGQAQAGLIVQIKDNQPCLHDAVTKLCDGTEPLGHNKTIDRGLRLRHETRDVEVFLPSKSLDDSKWADHVASVIRVKRETIKKDPSTGLWKTSRETAPYAVNFVISANDAANLTRAHWGVENRSHDVRDVSLDEDASRIRVNPGVFARLRPFAINLLRFNKASNVANARDRIAIGGIEALQNLQFM